MTDEATKVDQLRILAAFAPGTTIQSLDLEAMTVTVRLPKPLKYHSVPCRFTPDGVRATGPMVEETIYRPEIVCKLERKDGKLRIARDEETGETRGYMRTQ